MRTLIIAYVLLLSLAGCANKPPVTKQTPNPKTESKILSQAKHDFKKQHYKESFEKLYKIRNGNNPDVAYALAYHYYYGLGITENHSEARYWMRQAASQHDSNATKALELLNNPVGDIEFPRS